MTNATIPGPGALSDVRVLDMSTFIAGPFCAGLMAEFGADVTKIEQPGSGDSTRELGEKVNGRTLFWALEDRGRKSVTCNLRVEEGQAIALELIRQSDIVVENFRPGTLERWNLSYERMKEVNPGVILVRVSAYGQTGPHSDRPGFGRIAQAFGGLTYLAGFPDRPPALPGSATLADYAAGLFAAVGALAAKHHRDRTGEGQQVDISLFESIFRFTDVLALAYDTLGIVRERVGTAAHAAPHNHYPTGDGKWIAIACTNDRIFRRLTVCMGQEEWGTDPDFDVMEKRSAARDIVDKRVSDWTSAHTMAELQRVLDDAEVPNSPIYSIADAFQDEQYRARETLIPIEDPVIGPVMMPSPVARLSATPAAVQSPAPSVGEHTDEIYSRLLGFSADKIKALRDSGVI
jgi:crotonobetainyl-CoA:carnitine CoA-transferase CaiB-like acyl-CoA transferase